MATLANRMAAYVIWERQKSATPGIDFGSIAGLHGVSLPTVITAYNTAQANQDTTDAATVVTNKAVMADQTIV